MAPNDSLAVREESLRRCPSVLATLRAQAPDAARDEVASGWGVPDAVVLNAVHPISPSPIEEDPIDDLGATFEAVVVAPVRLCQRFLPGMKARGSVTSARETRPEPGFSVPTTARAAATAFRKALAKEAAPFGIQANVVAPNDLYSEMYYPKARFVDDPEGRAELAG